MKDNIATALKLIAGSEGGYSNHPNDPGGPTMKGVTLATYTSYCVNHKKPKPSINDLKHITDQEVEDIFRSAYWNSVRGDDLPDGVDYAAADFAFNSGGGQAVKELQRVVTALGFDTKGADGKMGTFTLTATRNCIAVKGADVVINAYMDKRWAFMQGLKNFQTFKRGWKARISDVRFNSLKIAHGRPANLIASSAGTSMNAKADPMETKVTSVPGGTSTIVSVGGACATGATSAAVSLLDNGAASGNTHVIIYAVIGFAVLTILASVITFFVLKNKPQEEGTV